MAHIPYGYRIQRGKAVVDPEKAGRVQEFFRGYLSGLSIQKAKEAAGLPVANHTANKMLRREVYLGDDYYPAIIGREDFDRAAEIRQERYIALGSRRTTGPKAAEPVRHRFRMGSPDKSAEGLSPAEAVAALYRCILPDEGGMVQAGNQEIRKINAWLKDADIEERMDKSSVP